jgi:ComF family protein
MALLRFIPSILQRTKNAIATLLDPGFCLVCSGLAPQRDDLLCSVCEDSLEKPPLAYIKRDSMVISVASAFWYESPLRLLLMAKHKSDRSALQGLARLLAKRCHDSFQNLDVLVPVPLHWSRFIWRGYNQAQYLADYSSQITGIVVENSIVRTRPTLFQRGSAQERESNVRGAFRVTAKDPYKIFEGKRVGIIDDVMTTGATIQNVAHALRPYRPASVRSLVFCRV